MEGDKIHKIDEQPGPPWSSLDPEEFSRSWTIGQGGYGLGSHTWTLKVIHDDATADIWPLPDSVGAVFAAMREFGRKDVRDDIQRAIGL